MPDHTVSEILNACKKRLFLLSWKSLFLWKEKKWKNSHDLMLSDMVSDILNSDNALIDDYFKEKINEKNRKVYLDI